MAKEHSPYEGTFDHRLNGKTCLGRVISVDINSKRCRVKTMGLKGSTDDLDLANVQWHQSSAHPEGDEDTTYPRVGQLGIITFMNSEPYISGWFGAIQGTGDDPRPTKEPLREGDKVIATIGGNRIILRSGASIEVESTKLCRTYWLPTRNLITTVCQDWELETDGGLLFWGRDGDTDDTSYEFFAWDNAKAPTCGLEVDIGTTESGAMWDMTVGKLDGNNDISEKLFNAKIEKDGKTTINIGPGKFTLEITPDGKVTMFNKGDLTMTTQGNVTQTVKGNVTQTVQGNVKQTVAGDTDMKATNITMNTEIQPEAGVTTYKSHQGVVDLITLVPVEQSQTVFAGD
jgi:phage gp45-like